MFNIGATELILLLLIAFVVVGAQGFAQDRSRVGPLRALYPIDD